MVTQYSDWPSQSPTLYPNILRTEVETEEEQQLKEAEDKHHRSRMFGHVIGFPAWDI